MIGVPNRVRRLLNGRPVPLVTWCTVKGDPFRASVPRIIAVSLCLGCGYQQAEAFRHIPTPAAMAMRWRAFIVGHVASCVGLSTTAAQIEARRRALRPWGPWADFGRSETSGNDQPTSTARHLDRLKF